MTVEVKEGKASSRTVLTLSKFNLFGCKYITIFNTSYLLAFTIKLQLKLVFANLFTLKAQFLQLLYDVLCLGFDCTGSFWFRFIFYYWNGFFK